VNASLSHKIEGGNMAVKTNIRFEHWFENLRGFVKQGVIILTADREVDFGNAEALEILGCPTHDELEARLDGVRTWIEKTYGDASGELGGTVPIEVRMPGEEKPRSIVCRIHRLDQECKGWVVLLQNKDALEGFETTLRDAAYTHTLSRVLATTAHDLKAPIHAMLLTLDILSKSVAQTAGAQRQLQERYIATLEEELSRFKRTLQDVLTDVTPSRHTFKRLDICELIRELARLIAVEASANDVEVKLSLAPDQVLVDGHRDQLKQALLNLMLNALDAMSNGGRLKVAVERSGNSVEISISDTGLGMNDAMRAQTFELHFTTKPRGTGIGLYVARSVAESHGGRIRVESAPGAGSTFRIALPAAAKEGPA
jgi:signal transduction histidine kinase